MSNRFIKDTLINKFPVDKGGHNDPPTSPEPKSKIGATKPFDSIKAGLEDAIAYVKGDKTRGHEWVPSSECPCDTCCSDDHKPNEVYIPAPKPGDFNYNMNDPGWELGKASIDCFVKQAEEETKMNDNIKRCYKCNIPDTSDKLYIHNIYDNSGKLACGTCILNELNEIRESNDDYYTAQSWKNKAEQLAQMNGFQASEIKELNEKLAEHEKRFATYHNNEVDELDARVRELENICDEKDKTISILENRVNDVEELCNEKNVMIVELEQENADLERELDEFSNQFKELKEGNDKTEKPGDKENKIELKEILKQTMELGERIDTLERKLNPDDSW